MALFSFSALSVLLPLFFFGFFFLFSFLSFFGALIFFDSDFSTMRWRFFVSLVERFILFFSGPEIEHFNGIEFSHEAFVFLFFVFHLFSGFVVGAAIWMRSCVMSLLNRSWWWKQWKRNRLACVSVYVCVNKSRCMCESEKEREREEEEHSRIRKEWEKRWVTTPMNDGN